MPNRLKSAQCGQSFADTTKQTLFLTKNYWLFGDLGTILVAECRAG
jgi:hypothetical protein